MISSIPIAIRWAAALFVVAIAGSAVAAANDAVRLNGAACSSPPVLQCPREGCPTDRVINQGPVVEMETRRTYFLDYPCDLQPDESVTLILSLHGGGSYGNWQRHYAPLFDFVHDHRLVVATPNSPIRVWTPADDTYLQNIVTSLIEQLGRDNIRAFWLVGHSQGGMTSNRLLRSDFFRSKVDGWVSLSGGRLGGNPERAENWGPPAASTPAAAPPAGTSGPGPAMFAQAAALLRELPEQDISFIYAIGEREIADLPEDSALADQLSCAPRAHAVEIEDTLPGYVYDASRQNPPNPSWGLLPGPGKASVHRYPNCNDGRVVADIVRHEKGHTEGLEPKITEALVELMLTAPGGRIRDGG
jgi:pimeloyl-ACP methyl ester carboxylesterase